MSPSAPLYYRDNQFLLGDSHRASHHIGLILFSLNQSESVPFKQSDQFTEFSRILLTTCRRHIAVPILRREKYYQSCFSPSM
jgi:hypothetical protein